jgi:hypothetical protein
VINIPIPCPKGCKSDFAMYAISSDIINDIRTGDNDSCHRHRYLIEQNPPDADKECYFCEVCRSCYITYFEIVEHKSYVLPSREWVIKVKEVKLIG